MAGPRVLIVEDDPTILELLHTIVSEKLRLRCMMAGNGQEALEIVENNPPDIIVTDLKMPVLDGIALLQYVQANYPEIDVMVITGFSAEFTFTDIIQMGASDFFVKPFRGGEFEAKLQRVIRERRLMDDLRTQIRQTEEYAEELIKTQEAAIFALAKLAESRDPETGGHLERIQNYTRVLVEELSTFPEYDGYITDEYIESVYISSPLHDIGKVGIRDAILLKPGKLTREEFEEMKLHTVIGGATLAAAEARLNRRSFLEVGKAIAYCHHEKWDGSGYPRGLTGEEIPLSARVMALADVYDALRSRRVYKPAWPHQEARTTIVNDAGKHFDPTVVEAFLRCEPKFLQIQGRFAHLESQLEGIVATQTA